MLPARPFHMIRHGETVMNARRLSCGGGIDTTLNDQGRRQALEAQRVLAAMPADERPTLIIHSGMKRTHQTTDIINRHMNLPVVVDTELREHMLGEFEEKPWDEIYPKLRTGVAPAGGESLVQFADRVRSVFSRHLADHAGERLMFVAHGGTFHAFQRCQGQNRRIFIPNATLHHFAPESTHQPMPWRVTYYEWKNGLRVKPAAICPSQPDPTVQTPS